MGDCGVFCNRTENTDTKGHWLWWRIRGCYSISAQYLKRVGNDVSESLLLWSTLCADAASICIETIGPRGHIIRVFKVESFIRFRSSQEDNGRTPVVPILSSVVSDKHNSNDLNNRTSHVSLSERGITSCRWDRDLKNFSALYGRRLNHWSKPEQHVLHQRALYSSFKLVSHISQSRLFAVTSVLSKISLRHGCERHLLQFSIRTRHVPNYIWLDCLRGGQCTQAYEIGNRSSQESINFKNIRNESREKPSNWRKPSSDVCIPLIIIW
jgi:hypothetical protein